MKTFVTSDKNHLEFLSHNELYSGHKIALECLENKAMTLYRNLCKDFGANPLTIETGFIRNSNLSAGAVTIVGKDFKNIWIAFSYGVYKILPDRTKNEIIPHEVCHAFVNTIFPQELEDWHGKEWREAMKYLELDNLGAFFIVDSIVTNLEIELYNEDFANQYKI